MDMTSTEAELKERIRAEKRLVALEYQSEAWADGIAEGIEPEILASAALETAIGGLVEGCGVASAAKLLENMRIKLETGGFSGYQFLN
jgi:hypothetical protein